MVSPFLLPLFFSPQPLYHQAMKKECYPPIFYTEDIKSIRRIEIPVGGFLYREEMPICYVYLLRRGIIGISRRDHCGVDRIATILRSGDIVGLDDLFRGESYTNKAIALKRTSLHAIPSNLFIETLSCDSHVAVHLLCNLADRIARSESYCPA